MNNYHIMVYLVVYIYSIFMETILIDTDELLAEC